MALSDTMDSAYSRDQLGRFLEYIQMPQKYRLEDNPIPDKSFLFCLNTHMISTVPYENLSLHYSKDHKISLELQHLYRKIVIDGRGRGGYCMEASLFYNQILRGLGFQAYTVGVKIRDRKDGVPHGNFHGWRHIVNIVTLADDTRFMVDVGFGGDGATKPLPLIDGHVNNNLGTQDVRLIRDWVPGQVHRTPESQMWIFQYRNSADKPFNSFYAFSDVIEFMPMDFHIMNWYTGSHPESFQTHTPLIVKFLRRPNEDVPGGEEIYGKRMLVGGTVKENLGGRTKIMQECKNETERTEALRSWFGIELTAEEVGGIRGHLTELKS